MEGEGGGLLFWHGASIGNGQISCGFLFISPVTMPVGGTTPPAESPRPVIDLPQSVTHVAGLCCLFDSYVDTVHR